MRLKDKVAVITGGGKGLGREIALAYAREGARIVVTGREVAPLEETCQRIAAESGGEAIALPADVCHEQSMIELARLTYERYAQVDLVVCNSGIGGPTKKLWEISLDEWEDTLATNLTGVFLTCKAFLPGMIERGAGGHVILIGSGVGRVALPGRTPYAGSKTGLLGLMRVLAKEVGEHRICVNMISPGSIDGERLQTTIRRQAEIRGLSYEAARTSAASQSVFGRFIQPQEVAQIAVFLASADSMTAVDINASAGQIW
jgi:NAD(P)-dependent dehydrogenase (short-subunit alcohol dehydrogenase family)